MKKPLGKTALKNYSVNLTDNIEELAWSLYDFTEYASAGQTVLTFFQSPVGANGKTLADTNMDSAGQIPKGQNFLVENICVEFFSGASIESTAMQGYADDVKSVMESGVLSFKVGSKLFKNEAPLGIFPPSYKQHGYAATNVAAENIVYASNTGTIHSIIPVRLTSNQNFSVSLSWASAVALPSTNIGRIGVRLGGRLFRNAQ